jgi:hypothetical protein
MTPPSLMYEFALAEDPEMKKKNVCLLSGNSPSPDYGELPLYNNMKSYQLKSMKDTQSTLAMGSTVNVHMIPGHEATNCNAFAHHQLEAHHSQAYLPSYQRPVLRGRGNFCFY